MSWTSPLFNDKLFSASENPQTSQDLPENKLFINEVLSACRTFTLRFLHAPIERMHSHVQQPGEVIGTKETLHTKELNTHRIGLVHQHARRFIVF